MNRSDIRVIPVEAPEDILEEYLGTPIESLFRYHNLRESFETYSTAQILVGMCMDNRKQLHIPDNFAFILRSGAGNLRRNEFKVSFAIAVGGVKAIALIGHTQCGMVGLSDKREEFVTGMVESAGWTRSDSENHFDEFSEQYGIQDEVEFAYSESERLGAMYPKLLVAPLLYKVEDSKLYQLKAE